MTLQRHSSGIRALLTVFLLVLLSSTPGVFAWDAAAHRLSASISDEYLLPSRREALLKILQQHPRYAEDFQAQMPAAIRAGSTAAQARWLLGQAAVWPDLARSLPERERRRYNHPNWHWIDGRWLRPTEATSAAAQGTATQSAATAAMQGNVYVGMSPLPPILNAGTGAVPRLNQVDNMMLALDYSLATLRDNTALMSERAIALCWVMHLLGDIHQPLHAGSLMSPRVFPDGDRGGNAIMTQDDNLHARWDQALSQQPLAETLQQLLRQAERLMDSAAVLDTDSDHWLQESRQILHSSVYSDEIIDAVLHSERTGASLPRFTLDQPYQRQMRQLSEQRLLLAGLRLARVLNDQGLNEQGLNDLGLNEQAFNEQRLNNQRLNE